MHINSANMISESIRLCHTKTSACLYCHKHTHTHRERSRAFFPFNWEQLSHITWNYVS